LLIKGRLFASIFICESLQLAQRITIKSVKSAVSRSELKAKLYLLISPAEKVFFCRQDGKIRSYATTLRHSD